MDQSLAEMDDAAEFFQYVLEEDSTYVPALAGMATVLMAEGLDDMDPAQLEQARQMAARAVALEPRSEEAQEILRSIQEAVASFQGTGEAVTVTMLAAPQSPLGRAVQEKLARVEIRAGHGDDPGSSFRAFYRLLGAGRLQEAEVVGRGLLPGAGEDEILLWEAMEQIQRLQEDVDGLVEVRRVRREAHTTHPGPSLRTLVRRMEEKGEEGYWSWKMEELRAREAGGLPNAWTSLATARLATGDAEGALAALEEAAERHEPLLALVRQDRVWDSLRNDPRYQEIFRGLRERMPEPRRSGERAPRG